MALSTKQLREERAELVNKSRLILENAEKESRDLTGEEEQEFERINAEVDSLKNRIDRIENFKNNSKDLDEAIDDVVHASGRVSKEGGSDDRMVVQDLAISGWMLNTSRHAHLITDEQRESAQQLNIDLNSKEIELALEPNQRELVNQFYRYRNAQSTISAPSGGVLIPKTFMTAFEMAMLAYGPMLQVADVIRTATGEPMQWPHADDTSNEGEQIGENTEANEQDATFKATILSSFEYSSKLVKVSHKLLRDAMINLAVVLGEMLGERLSRVLNRKFTTGTGAGTPWGYVTQSTLGVTAASATAITADEILDLENSVDPAYRMGARYMMHDNIRLHIRKLKTGDGQYLWQAGLQTGNPDVVNGYPLDINQHMQSSVATATKTIVFGNPKRYKARIVGNVKLMRLVERFATAGQDAFLANIAADGSLLESGQSSANKPVKHLLMA